MIKIIRSILFTSVCMLSIGCATQKNIALQNDFWEEKKSVVIVTSEAAKPEMHEKGAQGFLDYGFNSLANGKVDAHLKKTDVSWYATLSQDFVNDLEKRDVEAKQYDKEFEAPYPNNAKAYIELAQETQSDTLLLLHLKTVGAQRYYYSILPISDAEAICTLSGELVDANTGDVLWRYTSEIVEPVPEKWAEGPDYINLTQKLKLSMDTARKEILDNFFESAPVTVHDHKI